jgi:hypothetical protein
MASNIVVDSLEFVPIASSDSLIFSYLLRDQFLANGERSSPRPLDRPASRTGGVNLRWGRQAKREKRAVLQEPCKAPTRLIRENKRPVTFATGRLSLC